MNSLICGSRSVDNETWKTEEEKHRKEKSICKSYENTIEIWSINVNHLLWHTKACEDWGASIQNFSACQSLFFCRFFSAISVDILQIWKVDILLPQDNDSHVGRNPKLWLVFNLTIIWVRSFGFFPRILSKGKETKNNRKSGDKEKNTMKKHSLICS